MPIENPDDFLERLSLNVESLTASVQNLTQLFAADKTRLQVQRRNDKRIMLMFLGVFVVMIVLGGYGIHQAKNSCQSTNRTNAVVRSVFEPFKAQAVRPSPVPTGLPPAARAAFMRADRQRIAGTEQFYTKLEQQTAPKHC